MLDEFRSTNITWDKATRRIYSPITANESDYNGRKLNVQVVNSGQVDNLTGATLHLYWETKDRAQRGLDAFKASDISKGEFEIFYTTGMLSNVGELDATLVLVDTTGKVVSDWFKITVTRGINESAIESENSFSSLTQALIDISNLEQNYAPRLNDLTAQLAQTMSQEEFDSWVATILDGGPSIFFETLSALKTAYPQGSSGVALVRETDPARIYVWDGSDWKDFGAYQGLEVKDETLTNKKYANDSVSYKKQSVVNFNESDNLFSGNYSNLWVYTNGTNGLYQQDGLVSAVIKLEEDSVMDVSTIGNHNRFTLALLDSPFDDTAQEIIHWNSSTKGNEHFVFRNKKHKFLLICLNSDETNKPDLIVKELNKSIEFNQELDTDVSKPNSSWYVNADTNIWTDLGIKTGVIKPVLKDSKIRIKTDGIHNRFAVYTFEKYNNRPSEPTKIYPTGTNLNSTGNESIEFYNVLGNYVYIYVTTSANAYTPDVTITQEFMSMGTGKIQTESVVDVYSSSTGIEQAKEVHPVMFGVKMSNERDKSRGYSETPRPVGWLYYHPENLQLLYASGSPENMRYLCEWNFDVTWNGTSKPEHYRPFISRDGDIIFVWRGDLLGLEAGIPNVRQNPIVYPAGDWNNPIEVDLGSSTKPTAWLQNSGADFIYNQDVFLFSEYTRPSHVDAHVWKVTKPFTNPNNWNVVKSFELSGSNGVGMKHCHTINYDTFSGKVYLTTGDDDSAAKIFSSSDFGDSWVLELEGQRKYARVLNFVFTKEKVYWANDDSLHGFYSVDRDANGSPDFSNITELYDLSGNPPTYVNCLIDNPNGILILDRYDGATTTPLKVHFWHIPTSTMHVVAEIPPTGDAAKTFGFRVEAANFYQAKGSNKIVAGFGNPQNDMAILGNTTYALNKDRINNLVMEVVRDGDGFSLDFTTINDRS